MPPTILPNGNHVETTRTVRITILQFLVDRVVGISKQENVRIMFRVFLLRFVVCWFLLSETLKFGKELRLFFL